MATCTNCGNDVSGKKFCPDCGTAVQGTGTQINTGQPATATCSHCHGIVKAGAAFCMHCGAALQASSHTTQVTPPPPSAPVTRPCPVCHNQVGITSVFCTSCGHDMRVANVSVTANPNPLLCQSCGRQNEPGTRFCGGCGGALAAGSQSGYATSGQYTNYNVTNTNTSPYAQSSPYNQPSPYAQQPGYSQPNYQSQPGYPQQYAQQPGYPQQYPQQYAQQPGYQPQPMLGQQPMVVRCPTCMAVAPMGTPACVSCRTNLAGIPPMPANMVNQQFQQGGGMGGFFQGSGGKMAMGALGGAAAVIGGEMLLNGIENRIEDRVEDNMGMGGHRHHHREGGLLGGIGELADDIGLF